MKSLYRAEADATDEGPKGADDLRKAHNTQKSTSTK